MEELSIIVPVYNVEHILPHCINSILGQSYNNWKLILVDDGSKDLSGVICDDYSKKDSRITVIHKQNGGVSSARNMGIKAVNTRLFCFVDSDDFLESHFCEELMRAHTLYSDIYNVWTGFQTINKAHGLEMNKFVYDPSNVYSVLSRKNLGTLHEKWLDTMPFGKLFDINIIEKYQIKMPEDLSLGEDLIFNLEYLKYSGERILIINKPLYNYMLLDEYSLSRKKRSDLFEIYLNVNEKLISAAYEFKCGDAELRKCFKSCFYKYESALDNSKKGLDRIMYNNRILKSSEFWKCYTLGKPKIHFLYKIAYHTHNYFVVMIVNLIVKLKQSIDKNRKEE